MLGLMCIRFQTIVMHHYQEKAMHVLLLVVRFAFFDADDYFTLVAFQMVQLTLYVAWHVVFSAGNYDVHMQILTCLD
jgi:hypothetical protein